MDFNLAEVSEALAARLGDREALVTPAVRFTWSDLNDRTRRLANWLTSEGAGAHAERSDLADHEAGQDRVAICLMNGHEYIETMIGAFKARCAPCNVNYRYVAAELTELLADMAPRAIVYDSRFAPQLVEACESAGLSPLLIEVPGTHAGGGARLSPPGASDYEEVLSQSSAARPDLAWSPDDLYILYTGGTTGRPKGVLWRQADVFVTALGGRNYQSGGREWESLDELVEAAAARSPTRGLSAAPFMHGTGQWVSFQALHSGGTVVIPSVVDRYDASDVLETVEREHVNLLTIAGEAFAAPLVASLAAGRRDLSSLRVISSSGAALSPKSKEAILALLPAVRVRDTVGSSEAGPIADAVDAGAGSATSAGRFQPNSETGVIDEGRTRLLEPGHEGSGWLARGGRIPLGYMNDAAKTAATFISVGGRHFTVPGDRARMLADGTVEVLGRDAVTINSGGEKIFAEEVEAAVRLHAGVRDVLVVGRPSERWGSEVVALVEPEPGADLDAAGVIEACSAAIARYKLPKAVVFVERIQRNPAGKADYTWARTTALASAGAAADS